MSDLNINSLTIAMSAYNEEDNIETAVRNAFYVLPQITKKYEVLVVNDGSTDKTLDILNRLKKEFRNIRVISHKKNFGIGISNHTCYLNSSSDYIFWNASDNQIPMEELFKLVPYAREYDIVVGHRIARKDPLIRRINSRIYNLVLRLFFDITVDDIDSVKLFNRKIFKNITLKSKSAFIETEILIKAK
ncbi:MAG: glycosyltransferase family 2 protein, partial [Candidatus Margulisbacteria bacterium]|nr:glycosyltransferase family 2 protein [Candidatus Margulisiibacteriota bacterium]